MQRVADDTDAIAEALRELKAEAATPMLAEAADELLRRRRLRGAIEQTEALLAAGDKMIAEGQRVPHCDSDINAYPFTAIGYDENGKYVMKTVLTTPNPDHGVIPAADLALLEDAKARYDAETEAMLKAGGVSVMQITRDVMAEMGMTSDIEEATPPSHLTREDILRQMALQMAMDHHRGVQSADETTKTAETFLKFLKGN